MGWRSAENCKITGSRSLKTRLYQGRWGWTIRSGVVSVRTGGGCESAGVWVFWSETDRKRLEHEQKGLHCLTCSQFFFSQYFFSYFFIY